ncbi:unnamed protein product, partial [marine sediment metagenome]
MESKNDSNSGKQPFVRAVKGNKKIAILCAQRKSVYSHFTGLKQNSHSFDVEIYDKKRDARNFPGGMAVIAHPPCRLWGKLKHFVEIQPLLRIEEKEIGKFCAKAVIENGGILEQPFDSFLFEEMKLPPGGMENNLGFTLEIPQRMFGHYMIKNTWLFFSRIEYKELEPFL